MLCQYFSPDLDDTTCTLNPCTELLCIELHLPACTELHLSNRTIPPNMPFHTNSARYLRVAYTSRDHLFSGASRTSVSSNFAHSIALSLSVQYPTHHYERSPYPGREQTARAILSAMPGPVPSIIRTGRQHQAVSHGYSPLIVEAAGFEFPAVSIRSSPTGPRQTQTKPYHLPRSLLSQPSSLLVGSCSCGEGGRSQRRRIDCRIVSS